MNSDEIDASFIVQVLNIRFGLIVTPLEWLVSTAFDRLEGFAGVKVGPFELFVDW